MQPSREEIVAREARWSLPAGLSALIAVVLLFASGFTGAAVHGSGAAAVLSSAAEHSSAVTLSGVLNAIAFLLLVAPLVFLFRAVEARSDRVKGLMVGLCLIAPICLAVSSGAGAAARNEAADKFVAREARPTLTAAEAKKDCASDLKEKGAKAFGEEHEPLKGETALAACERTKLEDDAAENASSEASLSSIAASFGIAGGLSLIVALFYTSLWAMRTGVLGRFWASLGIALGFTVVLGVFLFALIWFAYLGLLITGWIPKGRPPAWAAGEAIPWPTAGEKTAAQLEGGAAEEPEPEAAAQPPDGERRKRKRRD